MPLYIKKLFLETKSVISLYYYLCQSLSLGFKVGVIELLDLFPKKI